VIKTPTAADERIAVIAFLRECRDHWRKEARRVLRNRVAADQCHAKAFVLDGVAKDIEDNIHWGST
jgi:hypothetical protein